MSVLREEIEDLLLAIVNHDVVLLTSLIMRIGSVPSDLDESALQNDLADFVSHYGTQSIEQLKLAEALEEMVEMIFRYHIFLPGQVAMLLKGTHYAWKAVLDCCRRHSACWT